MISIRESDRPTLIFALSAGTFASAFYTLIPALRAASVADDRQVGQAFELSAQSGCMCLYVADDVLAVEHVEVCEGAIAQHTLAKVALDVVLDRT